MLLLSGKDVDVVSYVLCILYAGFIGGLTGFVIVCLMVLSLEVVYVLMDFAKYLGSALISLVIVQSFSRHVFRRNVMDKVWGTLKKTLLINFFLISLSVAYVIFFNLTC